MIYIKITFYDVYIVRPNLYGALNENMQQAKAILRKAGVPETDKNWQVLKKMLVDDNRVGYIGKFTKWLIQEHYWRTGPEYYFN